MRLVLTRPRAQCAEWLVRLAAHGVDAVACPLIGIESAANADTARLAWQRLQGAALVVFVSPNAVEQGLKAWPAGAPWPDGVLAATVGPASARALAERGVHPRLIVSPTQDAANFDSETLWPLLAERAWAGRRALLLRGDGGREWLAERLREQGAEVEALAVYRRVIPKLAADEQAVLDAAVATPRSHVWLFSSSEAAANWRQLAGLPPKQALALATHPRIAVSAHEQGWPHVVLVRPEAAAVAAAFNALADGPAGAPTIV